MKYIYILLLTICIGCTGQWSKSQLNGEYSLFKKKFPNMVTSHFPSNVDFPYGEEYIIEKGNECIYWSLYQHINSRVNVAEIIDSSKAMYNAIDSNLIVVQSEILLSLYPERKNKYKNIGLGNTTYYPIPYFEEVYNLLFETNTSLFSPATKCGLSSDFDIYILDSKPVKYWDGDGLTPHKNMPEGWESGYSKGISINKKENIIIYWFVIW